MPATHNLSQTHKPPPPANRHSTMVQYVFTPWRDRQELLTVRRQLYPQHHDDDDDGGDNHHTAAPTATARAAARVGEQQHAVARVSMWMQRGGCPHLVESTALLRAAILSDPDAEAGAGSASGPDCGAARSSGSYAARAAYSAAFSRYVLRGRRRWKFTRWKSRMVVLFP